MTQDDRQQSKDRELSRRSFLKWTLAGTGGMALGGFGLTAEAQGGNGTGSGNGNRPTPDPATAGNFWPEPMVWNQSDWPGQALALNVTKNATPTIYLPGNNPDSTFLSYNGSTPGPTIRVRGDDVLHIKLRNFLSANTAISFVIPATDLASEPLEYADWCLGEHVNGLHELHTTNLHTHGLHVRPGRNPDGTQSDNILLRVIPRGDYSLREASQDPLCWPLEFNEVVAEADFEYQMFALRRDDNGIERKVPHPPGTHWYHPHSHGSTYLQVSSGMAGLLIVEGDVDDVLETKYATNNYRERLIVFQRITPTADLADAESINIPQYTRQQSKNVAPVVNGQQNQPLQAVVQPGSMERWRILNGSVDGGGYIALAMFKGDVPLQNGRVSDENFTPEIRAVLTAPYLFGVDTPYTNYVNSEPPPESDVEQFVQPLRQLAFDGVTLVSPEGDYTTRQPYSIALDPANRTDILFRAPSLEENEDYRVFTLVALARDDKRDGGGRENDIVLARVIVRGEALSEPDFDINFPPVPDYLQPITLDDISIKEGDPDYNEALIEEYGQPVRTREVTYSGWGNKGFTPETSSLLPSGERVRPTISSPRWGDTMAIDGEKFAPYRRPHQMLQNTAEEWTVNNCSITTTDGNGGIVLEAVDHPFHIHTNPFYLLRVEVPDKNGNLVNILPEPRWQDVMSLPRNGGRIIYRQRYPDFEGMLVNHCHILQHEDRGMMQTIEIVRNAAVANYDIQAARDANNYYEPKSFVECFSRCETVEIPVDEDGQTFMVVNGRPIPADSTPTPVPATSTPSGATATPQGTPIPPAPSPTPSPTPGSEEEEADM